MKTRILVAVTAILAFAVAGSLSPVRGEPQQESPHKGPAPITSPIPPETKIQEQGGEVAGMGDTTITSETVIRQVDTMMQQMTVLIEKSQSYSKQFGLLAATHHGADKSEILMMQRMSDSMGMMAGEIKGSLQQYKEMLEDETTSESGSMKAEVLSFRGILDGIARNIQGAVNTLQVLEERLGQG
jgi:hypothetical protein